jgi:hypothetical protein
LWNNLSPYNLSFTKVISGFFPFYRYDRSQNGKEITSSQLQIQQQQQADSQNEKKSVKKDCDLGGMMRDIMDVPFPRADSKALISFLIFHISIFLSVSPPSAICTTTNTLPLTSLLACLLACLLASTTANFFSTETLLTERQYGKENIKNQKMIQGLT